MHLRNRKSRAPLVLQDVLQERASITDDISDENGQLMPFLCYWDGRRSSDGRGPQNARVTHQADAALSVNVRVVNLRVEGNLRRLKGIVCVQIFGR